MRHKIPNHMAAAGSDLAVLGSLSIYQVNISICSVPNVQIAGLVIPPNTDWELVNGHQGVDCRMRPSERAAPTQSGLVAAGPQWPAALQTPRSFHVLHGRRCSLYNLTFTHLPSVDIHLNARRKPRVFVLRSRATRVSLGYLRFPTTAARTPPTSRTTHWRPSQAAALDREA